MIDQNDESNTSQILISDVTGWNTHDDRNNNDQMLAAEILTFSPPQPHCS